MQGDESADNFDLVYQTYADRLYRIAVSLLRSSADAEDAVQTVFCRFLEKAVRFTEPEHEKAWLIKVTVNQCRDMLRRRKLREWLPLDEMKEVGAAQPLTPALDAVYALPLQYKTVMVLYYLEELSVSEVSEALSLSPSAVKMRLSRARELLRDQLQE